MAAMGKPPRRHTHAARQLSAYRRLRKRNQEPKQNEISQSQTKTENNSIAKNKSIVEKKSGAFSRDLAETAGDFCLSPFRSDLSLPRRAL